MPYFLTSLRVSTLVKKWAYTRTTDISDHLCAQPLDKIVLALPTEVGDQMRDKHCIFIAGVKFKMPSEFFRLFISPTMLVK